MKSGLFAVLALLGHVSAVQLRRESMYDPEFYAGLYTNILLDTTSEKHHHDKNGRKDAYDLDPHTVSPYDDMTHHKTWTNEERKAWFDQVHDHQKNKYQIFDVQLDSQNYVQRGKKDAYDYDPTTASPYDSGNNINGGNVFGSKSSYTDNDTPIGPKEKDLVAAIKKGYWWDKELEKELARPAGAGQADAREGYSGAIPYKNKKLYCEGVGASCEADAPVKAADSTPDPEAESEKEAAKEAGKIVAEEKAKEAKKEKGEGPEESAPEKK